MACYCAQVGKTIVGVRTREAAVTYREKCVEVPIFNIRWHHNTAIRGPPEALETATIVLIHLYDK